MQNLPVTQHDQLFKELLHAFFAEFLDLFAPDLAAQVDRGAIEFLDRECFSDLTAGNFLEPDVIARVKLRGAESWILVHLEHQAQPQAEFTRRIFHYFPRLHENHDIPVVPIAFFSHGALRP